MESVGVCIVTEWAGFVGDGGARACVQNCFEEWEPDVGCCGIGEVLDNWGGVVG